MKRKYTEETKQKIAEATRKREAARKKAEAADPLLEMANKQQRSEAARKGHATRGKKRHKTKFHNCSDDHSLADQSYGSVGGLSQYSAGSMYSKASLADQSYGSVGDNHSLSGVSWRDRSSSVPTNIITRN